MVEVFGIADTVWIVAILLGGVVGASLNQMRPKRAIPLAEIYIKKGGAIVWFVDAQNVWWPFAIKKTRNGYFSIYTTAVKGLFHIDHRKSFRIAGSNMPNYVISTRDMNNYDPIDIAKVNQFLDDNGIFIMRRKDMKQLNKLRTFEKMFGKGEKAKEKFGQELEKKKPVIEQAIKNSEAEALEKVQNYNAEHQTDFALTDNESAKLLIDYMLRNDFINDVESDTLLFKLENDKLNYASLKDELRDFANMSVTTTVDTSIDRILEDFGSQIPHELTGVIDDARTSPKELKKMTPVPVKQFIPGGVILAIGIVIIMAIAVIGQNPGILDNITGGFSLPGL